jgi:putative Mg2+ transporter-C (MgtC) family protein
VLDWPDILLRLGAATLACGAIGLNRDLHGKPIGLRTLGLVGLATASVMIFIEPAPNTPGAHPDAASRVIQGILTGIGFLGAGVIVHAAQSKKVHGLTSAACVWLAACIGIVCGTAQWALAGTTLAFAFALLLLGGPIERAFHGMVDANDEDTPPKPPAS